jgi:hypothetical protein
MSIAANHKRWAALPLSVAFAALLLASLLLSLKPGVVKAGGVVTTCDQLSLAGALAGGGNVTFNCGAPATITFSSPIVITQNTTIDGGVLGQVALSGGNVTRLFSTTTGATLELLNLTLRYGAEPAAQGGSLLVGGPLLIDHSEFFSNTAQGGGAIAVVNSGGPVTITGSVFHANSATLAYKGGAIAVTSGGSLTIRASTFYENDALEGGAVWVDFSPLIIEDSVFHHNSADYQGGAVNSFTALTVRGSEFYSNTAQYGGAIMGLGWLTLTDSSLHHNVAFYSGGGLYAGDFNSVSAAHSRAASAPQVSVVGHAFVSHVDIFNNTAIAAGSWGGGVNLEGTWAGLDHVRIFNNRVITGAVAYAGGGVSVFYGTAVFTNSSIYDNSTGTGSGGGIHASYGATLTLVASAVYSNAAPLGLGGGINIGTAGGSARLRIYNSTMSGNSALTGGGIGQAKLADYAVISYTTLYGNAAAIASNFTGTAELHGSILAGSGGLNCGGSVKSYGYNLDDGNTCMLDQTGDITSTNPLLGPLGFNGGPTLTHSVLADSPVIDAGDPDLCPPTDQRGGARPVDGDNLGGARCDMGAYEFGALIGRLFLPLLLR